jgi:hypothetical protein
MRPYRAPAPLDVLDAIADAPVDRKVAKAARKARLGCEREHRTTSRPPMRQ